MAGPLLATARLLGAPGVPRLSGTGKRPATSSQFPFKRSRASGQPFSQRALKRSVAVWPEASVVLVSVIWAELAPDHMRSAVRKCRALPPPPKPAFESMEEREKQPCNDQPARPLSKSGFDT